MSEPIWLDVDEVIDMHAEQLAIFGGLEGIRHRGLLELAVLRSANRWNDGQTDMAALAAAYAFGLARNHAFMDGNKRIAFHAMMVFLRGNDIAFAFQLSGITKFVRFTFRGSWLVGHATGM